MISIKMALDVTFFTDISEAVLNSPKANLPRTPEAALRRSIPSFNPNVLQIQVNFNLSLNFNLNQGIIEVFGRHSICTEDSTEEAMGHHAK